MSPQGIHILIALLVALAALLILRWEGLKRLTCFVTVVSLLLFLLSRASGVVPFQQVKATIRECWNRVAEAEVRDPHGLEQRLNLLSSILSMGGPMTASQRSDFWRFQDRAHPVGEREQALRRLVRTGAPLAVQGTRVEGSRVLGLLESHSEP